MATSTTHHVPALGFDVLTPFYDALISLTFRERRIKGALVEATALRPEHRVLDIGCGTGTLALMLKTAQPAAEVVGLDVDPRILAIAARKAARAGLAVTWVEGSAAAPPLEPGSFDRVTSSLMLHHLTLDEKTSALRAARALLRPGGSMHILDFAKPHSHWARAIARLFRHVDGVERTGTNLDGHLPDVVAAAGFDRVTESAPWGTPFGAVTLLHAS